MKKIFLLLSVFLGIYLVGVLMFIGRFSIGSYVDNISLVYKTPGEAAMELTHQTQSNVITFVSESFGTECLTFEFWKCKNKLFFMVCSKNIYDSKSF